MFQIRFQGGFSEQGNVTELCPAGQVLSLTVSTLMDALGVELHLFILLHPSPEGKRGSLGEAPGSHGGEPNPAPC